MALDEPFGHAELVAHAAHLVFEEPLQRLAQLQVHVLGQSANVVVALYHHARDAEALYPVGVDGALGEPLGIGYLLGFGVEHLDEVAPYYLSFLLGVGHTGKVGKELLARVDAYHVEPKALVCVHHLVKLVLAEHSVVYEYAGEVVAYGLVKQHSTHRRVYPARQAEYHPVVAKLLLELCHGGLYKRGRAPLLAAAADVDHEVAQKLLALGGMEHLGMELHGPQRICVAGVSGILHAARRSYYATVGGYGRDGVAMAHPHLRVGVEPLEERVPGFKPLQMGTPILAGIGLFDLTATRVGNELRPVTDAKYRQAAHKLAEVGLERLGVVHRIG